MLRVDKQGAFLSSSLFERRNGCLYREGIRLKDFRPVRSKEYRFFSDLFSFFLDDTHLEACA